MLRNLFGNGTRTEPRNYAVLDVETTGLRPSSDRVVEIAIVRLDESGEVKQDFCTLLNPRRDLGPTHIHGLTARDVLDAPLFRDVAGDISKMLAGAVIVAHNSRFDIEFITAEFSRLGYSTPATASICTIRFARLAVPSLGSYTLSGLTRQFGISHTQAHSALSDAQATAALFRELSHRMFGTEPVDLSRLGCQPDTIAAISAWPDIEATGKILLRLHAAQRRDPQYLATLVERLSPTSINHDAASSLEYVDLLNRVLEDRRVSRAEVELLMETATRWGLSPRDVAHIHQGYLGALVRVAMEDGVVTPRERRDLQEVSALLGYDDAHVDRLLNRTATIAQSPTRAAPIIGLSICFTGESMCTLNGAHIERAQAEQLAARAGMVVKPSVTKALDILVLADPDSMSGKAVKARRYGIRLMAEPVFWRELGVPID